VPEPPVSNRMTAAAEHVEIADRAALHAWLVAHHEQTDGVWIVFRKGAARTMNHGDIVEEALSFGWIDSKVGRVDDERTKLWLAPRRRGSAWSRVNKEIVERLVAAGAMHPSGLAAVEAAKADGTWTALDAVEALEAPPELAAALAESSAARTNWDAFPRSAKRAILEWIAIAKRPETRENRIRQTVEEAAENRRANEWRRKG
jgi:uncharacterized protein YdeI (YjbR/CyaY-like superfamily)